MTRGRLHHAIPHTSKRSDLIAHTCFPFRITHALFSSVSFIIIAARYCKIGASLPNVRLSNVHASVAAAFALHICLRLRRVAPPLRMTRGVVASAFPHTSKRNDLTPHPYILYPSPSRFFLICFSSSWLLVNIWESSAVRRVIFSSKGSSSSSASAIPT